MKKYKRQKKQYVPYDYEAAYSKAVEDMHEWFLEQLAENRKKVVYALKEITAGDQLEVEIYPQFKNMDEVPEEGRRVKKDNSAAQRNLNEKNSRKYVERLINVNFGDGDIWITLTYDDAHLPPDGDIDAAIKNVQRWIARINYRRKKLGLPNARYVYVTEYDPDAKIRWHHHVVMDGLMDMDTVEACWRNGRRNEVRRLKKDENGLSGMANYIVKEKHRLKSKKRWNSSKNLKKPGIRVVHSKRPAGGKRYEPVGKYVDRMVRDHGQIREVMGRWYPDCIYTDAEVFYNGFNRMFYIHVRLHRGQCRQDPDPGGGDGGLPWEG